MANAACQPPVLVHELLCAAQVRADCGPSQLLDFLAGGLAAAASEAAEEAACYKAAEEELLDKVATSC